MQYNDPAAVILEALVIINALQRQIANLTDERNEARRLFCRHVGIHNEKWYYSNGTPVLPREVAERMGWGADDLYGQQKNAEKYKPRCGVMDRTRTT